MPDTDANAKAFLHQLSKAYDLASSNATLIEKYYKLAGFVIKLEFISDSLVPLIIPALGHLQIDSVQYPDFSIRIWDSASTKSTPIEFPWPRHPNAYSLRGEVLDYNTADIHIVVDKHTTALNVFDKKNNTAYFWVDDVKNLPWWVSGSPLQHLLHWWMREKGFQLTHVGAVGYPEGGVLLAGSGGAGKSTTTLNCIKQGMQFVSEDYCLLGNIPHLHAYAVYSSAKLEQKTLDFFPELKPYISNTQRQESDKAFLFQHDFWPEKIANGFPIKAILVLKIQDSPNTWLEETSTDNALKALSTSTMWQLTLTGKATFLLLQKAVESVPCYFLHLGSDLKQIPEVIKSIL